MPSDGPTHNVTLGLRRKSLEASVIHACSNCGAPGVFKADERTRELWPGCFDPLRPGHPVGDQCPNCKNTGRRANLDLGEVAASMPKALWTAILIFKWCIITTLRLKRSFR